jgi:hypothetical protein
MLSIIANLRENCLLMSFNMCKFFLKLVLLLARASWVSVGSGAEWGERIRATCAKMLGWRQRLFSKPRSRGHDHRTLLEQSSMNPLKAASGGISDRRTDYTPDRRTGLLTWGEP